MSLNSKAKSSFDASTLPITLALLESFNTPISLSIYMLANAAFLNQDEEAYVQLASYALPISSYLAHDVDRFRIDYQSSVLFSKLPNVLGKDLKAEALDAFSEAEYHCNRINHAFLAGIYDHIAFDQCGVRFDDIKHKLSWILGRAPSWSSVLQTGGWGPGSSISLTQRDASPETKCQYERTVTYKLLTAIQSNLDSCPPWFLTEPFQLVPGNLITTVPKNLKTDRTIAIEPGVNSWVQKGIGTFIRRRLKRRGIDLNNQSFNATAALEALQHDFCTVDLKAASDSISLEFLRRVLPSEWLRLIEASRSERGTFQTRNCRTKTWFDYQKVSSMGNGFTFELESAIFFAVLLACGVSSNLCYVYGDDLVFPRSYSQIVCKTLEVCGFRVNSTKSFLDGLFYESCGSYSFNGVDVTPLKVKDVLNGPKDIIVLANKIRVTSYLFADSVGCDRRFLPAWRMCISGLPDDVRKRCRGPVGSGLTLFVNRDEAPLIQYKRKFGKLCTYQLVPLVKEIEAQFSTLIKYRISQLSNCEDSSPYSVDRVLSKGNVVLNRPTGRYKTARLLVERWFNFGSWVSQPN